MIGTRVEINLNALAFNYENIRAELPAKVKIGGVVKANAYGHDLLTITKKLMELGCDYILTATVREALSIRMHLPELIKTPVLVMGATFELYFLEAVQKDISLTIFNLEQAQKLNEIGKQLGKKVVIHVKIDTGFNRLGYKDHEQAIQDIMLMTEMPWIKVEGIFTHLALANAESDAVQFEQFDKIVESLETKGINIPIKHVCDSIGAVAYPRQTYDMVRLGALLYGFCSRPTPFELKPVMAFKTNIAALKWIEAGEGISYDYTYRADSKRLIATLPVGYADGLPRSLSNRGFVWLGDIKAPVVGLVCMDQCMVDVTDVPDCHAGDDVVLFDSEHQTVTELAKLSATNRNNILSGISMRVPRVFVKESKTVSIVDYML